MIKNLSDRTLTKFINSKLNNSQNWMILKGSLEFLSLFISLLLLIVAYVAVLYVGVKVCYLL